MSTTTSLTLRALLKTAVARTGIDAPGGTIAGLSPSAQALALASLSHSNPERLVVAVVPTDADVERLTDDTRFFSGAIEGRGRDDIERLVLPFPSHEVDPYRGLAPHLRVASARARALFGASAGDARIVIASAVALLPRVSPPQRLLNAALSLAPEVEIAPHDLAELLVDAGFTCEDPVDEHGEFCVRGGIVDLFPPGSAEPFRIEFIGDTIETIRRFDPASQRSTGSIDQVHITPMREALDAGTDAGPAPLNAKAFDHFVNTRQPLFVVMEIDDVQAAANAFLEQVQASYTEATTGRRPARVSGRLPQPAEILIDWDTVASRLANATRFEELAIDTPAEDESLGAAPAPRVRHVSCQPTMEFRGRVQDWMSEIRASGEREETVLFFAETPGRAERMLEVAREYGVIAAPLDRAEDAHAATLLVGLGRLSRGFRLLAGRLVLYAETDIFEEERHAPERRRAASRAFLSDLRDLKVGDLVVHVDHGIGVFVGLKQIGIGVGEAAQEFMELRYAGEDKLFVPVERLDLVQKYTGASRPPIDRLGGTTWERAKTRVKKAMRDMAEELLKLYAARKTVVGHAFSPDTHWQQEFEDAFPYDLTPDQSTAISDIKADMESATPMDRLLCGDVGYGKTEVAMRAAFKAVMDGKQVAFLAPTTVLAFQHVKTLRERFAAFPVRIDMVSRFRTKAEQKQSLEDLAAGKVEIIVGTHRLLSKDVQFRDLGLLVVDEEQRFGVVHKEKIKQLRKRVDVLTMTATPIPRTLNMSLVGIRDMSIIETPPKDRLSIQTNVVKFDAQVIARAIKHELERGGQVYFVHNRVESIYSIANLVTRLVPDARVVVGHGQMTEDGLERAMLDFVARKYDVLVATTIVENGLDIPNANTMIINRADRYGLAQLYQLRGRVGRSDRAAYAYLLVPPEDNLSPVAKKRLAAIREFSDLGSGFRVAALDLEIRGAGNLLGGEQSGQIETVGFEMYMTLLEQTVRELKGEEIEDDARAAVNLRVDLKVDETYIPDMNQRLMIYRQMASARREEDLERTLADVRDRYGPLPPSVLNLADYGRIRIMADRLGVEAVDREGQVVVFRFRPQAKLDPQRLVSLVNKRSDVTLVPPAGLRLDLRGAAPRVAPRPKQGVAPTAVPTPSSRPSPWPDLGRRQPTSADVLAAQKGTHRPAAAPGSWWTARATAGEVVPGFSKAEILRPQAEDPRAADGVFTKVAGLLGELLR
ncbi:MAG TPA: transcription-repair coupling factor [Vicinamibacterales bacterium]|nr:transcription-repair coupling factor [Vicinamibacterales bacterium]